MRVTQYNIPEDVILHSHCHENLKSYMVLDCLMKVVVTFSDHHFWARNI
jgi:hypothetical protein